MSAGRRAAPAAGLLFAALAGRAAPLRGQEPPSHFPTCSSDSLAGRFLTRVRFLVGGGDDARRLALHLLPAAPETVRLVVEEPVCLTASFAYARAAHGGTALAPPFPVVVVRAGEQFLVQLGGLGDGENDQWEIAVFDAGFRLAGIDPPRRR